MRPEFVRNIAALAPGKNVTVFADDKAYSLPEPLPPPPLPPPPDPIAEAARAMLERDAENRATIEDVRRALTEVVENVGATVAAVAAGQAEIVESLQENTRTLQLPVRPVYDKAGKLLQAQRVKG